MLKTHWRLISRLERIADNFIVVAAFLLAYYLRDPLLKAANGTALPFPQELLELGPIDQYYAVLGLGLPLFNAMLSMLGGYRSMRFASVWSVLRVAVCAALLVFLCEGSFLYLLKIDLSRSFLGVFCGIAGLGLLIERLFVLFLLRFFRARGKNFRNILIVGTGKQARKLYLEVVKQRELGVRVVGFVKIDTTNTDGDDSESAVYDLPARVLVDADSFEAALKKYAVDEVLFTDVIESFKTLEKLAEIAVEEGVQVTIAADIFSLEIFQSDISYFGNIPLIHYHASRGVADSPALVVKRGVDIVLSSIALVVLSPFLIFISAWITFESPGPVFFRQRRVGRNGRIFVLYKFRSMVVNAEEMLSDLKEKNEMLGPVFKIRNDPRITRVGKFIRRFSIDELPQLLNVLRGDMSLVGPRPPLPEEVTHYMRKQRRRLSMRPGLTCTWQVSGRNEIPDFDHWAQLDLEYIDNWSLWNDFCLLLKTVPAVLSGTGAR